MQRVVFRQCEQHSPYWQQLERLFQSEWLDFEFKASYSEVSNLDHPPVTTGNGCAAR